MKLSLFSEKKSSCIFVLPSEYAYNKNAFQWDVYRPLVALISQHALLRGVYLLGCVPGPGGCTCLGGVSGPRGVYLVLAGCTCPEGCTWSGGVPGPGGGVPAQVLPSVNRMTDRCKNITLPQTSFAGGNNSVGDF